MIGNRGHSWTWKVCNWFCCAHCGLVPLNNEATRKAMRAPCPSKDPTNEQ